MKSTEFRIGNIVFDTVHREPITLTSKLIDWAFNNEKTELSPFGFEPIPLTEEWLLKLGFEITWSAQGDGTTYELDGFPIHSHDFGKHFKECQYDVKLKYVHKIQNLYFELTGKELTIK